MRVDWRDWRNHTLLQVELRRLADLEERAQHAGVVEGEDLEMLSQISGRLERFR